ncbi:hypothetical protein [Candidatus Pseudoruminococcus sp.]|uniref:hypothetical protein n=1 Tax=Candidatus Pseudoruminococcus sp. TaxID=3101048 RepID=UPI00399A77C7
MAQQKQETAIQNAIRAELSQVGIVRRNNVGTYITPYGAPIKIGIPGEADLTLFAYGGKTIFIEVKTNKGKQSKAQKHFEDVAMTLGFEYIVMRSREDAVRLVKRLRGEIGGKAKKTE